MLWFLACRCITDPAYEETNNAFERALVFLHKVCLLCWAGGVYSHCVWQMPRIWLMYCQFLMDQCKITQTRRAFDRALQALPLTQHHRIWPLYIKFVRKHNVVETTLRVYRRYMKVCTWPCAQCTHNWCPLCSGVPREHRRVYWVLKVNWSSWWGSKKTCWDCEQGKIFKY